MRKHLSAALLAVCPVLIVPAFAAAHPVKRDFNATFPHASALCVNVAAGETPKRLAGSVDKIKAACDTLHTSFEEARTTFTAAVTPLREQATAALTTLRATCKQARADHDPAACRAARQSTRESVKALRSRARDAAKAYHEAIRAARKAFWTTIKALRGAGAVTPDTTSGPDPSVTLPSDAQVQNAG